MSKLTALISLPAGILLGLDFFKIIKLSSYTDLDVVLIGAIILTVIQVFTLIMHKFSEGEVSMMSFIIPVILAVPGIAYIISVYFPFTMPLEPGIVIAAFLFTEGLYALH